nr:sugar transport protein 1-like [Ipomoea batatas]
MIERGNHGEAKSRLRRIRGVENVDEEFNDLVAASKASNQIKHPWKNLLERNNASLIPSVITGLVNVLTTLVSVAFVDRAGEGSSSLKAAFKCLFASLHWGEIRNQQKSWFLNPTMAGGGIAHASSKEYPENLPDMLLFTCMVAAMGGGVTSMDSFLERFFPDVYRKQALDSSTNQYCKFNSETLTMFTSSLYLAALVSSMVASYVTRKLGRRISMMAGGLIFLVGALFNGFAQALWMLIVGRVLLGLGIGFANQEVAKIARDGAIKVGRSTQYRFPAFHHSGDLNSQFGSFFLPDTPNSMIERGNHGEAKSRLRRIRGVENVDEEFNDLVAASKASNQIKHPWKNLLERKYRP